MSIATRQAKLLLSRKDWWRLSELTWDQISSRKTYPRQWSKDTGLNTELIHKLVHMWEVYGPIDPQDRPDPLEALEESDSKWLASKEPATPKYTGTFAVNLVGE